MTTRFQSDVRQIGQLDLNTLQPATISRFALAIVHDGAGDVIRVPVLVARGASDGPVVGITAAIHGNEINGIPVIHKLFTGLDASALNGTIIGCPIMNMPAYLANLREMDGFDINRMMPGRQDGNAGEIYAYRLCERLLVHFNYLVDLHTASFGRANSLYVRADLDDEPTLRMARLQQPEIIVHNEPKDGTFRGAAHDRGIPAITVEVGNPLRFEPAKIRDSLLGIKNVLASLEMIDHPIVTDDDAVECSRSFWIYAQHGGLLEVLPQLLQRIVKGEPIARVRNIFGDVLAEYTAPNDGIVVGRATNPVCQTGARVLHLGVAR